MTPEDADPDDLPPREMPEWTPQPFPGVRAICNRPDPAPCPFTPPPNTHHKRPAWSGMGFEEEGD